MTDLKEIPNSCKPDERALLYQRISQLLKICNDDAKLISIKESLSFVIDVFCIHGLINELHTIRALQQKVNQSHASSFTYSVSNM